MTYKIEKMNLKDDKGQVKEYYCLKCYNSQWQEQPIRITKDDLNTLILYKPLN